MYLHVIYLGLWPQRVSYIGTLGPGPNCVSLGTWAGRICKCQVPQALRNMVCTPHVYMLLIVACGASTEWGLTFAGVGFRFKNRGLGRDRGPFCFRTRESGLTWRRILQSGRGIMQKANLQTLVHEIVQPD